MGNKSLYARLRDLGVKTAVDVIVGPGRCKECGFPLRTASALTWKGNGTIAPMFIGRYMRVVIHHTGMNDRLFEQIQEQLGISIEHILFEAQRNIAKSLFGAYLYALPGLRHIKSWKIVKRFVVEGFNKVGLVSGMGYARHHDYVPGHYLITSVKNPYSMAMVAANAAGALEFLEDCPYRIEIVEEGKDEYLMKFVATTERPAVSGRLGVDLPETVRSFNKLDRCSHCRVPLKVSARLKWLDKDGEIIDILSNSRAIMIDALLLRVVMRELATELGEEVSRMLVTAQRDWTIEHVEMLGLAPGESRLTGVEFEAAIKSYLDDLPIFGYGIATGFSMKGPRMEVVIENPFEEEVLAGTLQGLYQAFSGEECKVNWTTSKLATVSYSIEPA